MPIHSLVSILNYSYNCLFVCFIVYSTKSITYYLFVWQVGIIWRTPIKYVNTKLWVPGASKGRLSKLCALWGHECVMAPLTLTLIDGLHIDQRQDGHAASVLFMLLRTESNQLSRLLQFTAFLGIRIIIYDVFSFFPPYTSVSHILTPFSRDRVLFSFEVFFCIYELTLSFPI